MLAKYQKILFESQDEDLNTVYKNNNFSERMMEESIERLKDWYKLQPHLPQIDIEERYIIRLLCRNGFSVEKAKSKIDNLFSAKSLFTDCYADKFTIDDRMKNIFNVVDIANVPQLTDDGCRISVFYIRDRDPSEFDWEAIIKISNMLADLQLWGDNMVGVRIIWDCTHTKMGHVLKIPLVTMKKLAFLSQNCYGAKFKSFHVINGPNYVNSVVNVFKMGIKKKLSDRFYSHNSLEDLHKHIPPKNLPKDLGGQQKSYAEIAGSILDVLQKQEIKEILEYMGQFKADESKRMSSSESNISEILGIMGTFRKLDID